MPECIGRSRGQCYDAEADVEANILALTSASIFGHRGRGRGKKEFTYCTLPFTSLQYIPSYTLDVAAIV